MRKNQFPLVICYGFPVGQDEFHFLGRQGVIKIHGFQQELNALLPLCNGYMSLEEICDALQPFDQQTLRKLVNVCEKQDVLIDSRQLYRRFHLDSVNPGNFMHSLSAKQVARLTADLPVDDLNDDRISDLELLPGTDTRASLRHFAGKAIDAKTLQSLLASMYRVSATRSVPSGGALYPLTLYLVLLVQCGQYKPGIYRHNHFTLELEWVKELPHRDAIERAFDSRELLSGAVGSIIITADLDRSTGKYANRGYRYTVLEAGHVAQNAYLFCQNSHSEELGVVEYGGFFDEEIADLIGLKFPRFAPIVSLMIGVAGDTSKPLVELDQSEEVRKLEESLVGEGKPVAAFSIFQLKHGNLSMAQWTASADLRNPAHMDEPNRNESAFATGVLVNEATAKVLGEAYERFVCFQPCFDTFASAEELTRYVDPRQYAPYLPGHPAYRRYDLDPFDPSQHRGWLYGTDYNGDEIAVPIDLVYYAAHPAQKRYCYIPSSTGVAAHPLFEQARLNAMLELIERDAIAVHWYAQRNPSRIPEIYLPAAVRERKRVWEQAGWQVYILDLTLDLTPVAMVLLINHQKYPALASGAASAFKLDAAVTKAFSEAEYMGLSWQKRRKKIMTPERVRLPDQHGLLYADLTYFSEFQHLLVGQEQEKIHPTWTADELAHRIQAVTVRMDRGDYPLSVVRVLSDKLLPLTFGYETEHYGHTRLDVLKYAWNRQFPSIPHIFS